MSQYDKKRIENEEEETPILFPVGILLSCFAAVPLIYGLTQKQIEASIIGGVMILIGLGMTCFGYFTAKKKGKK